MKEPSLTLLRNEGHWGEAVHLSKSLVLQTKKSQFHLGRKMVTGHSLDTFKKISDGQ